MVVLLFTCVCVFARLLSRGQCSIVVFSIFNPDLLFCRICVSLGEFQFNLGLLLLLNDCLLLLVPDWALVC